MNPKMKDYLEQYQNGQIDRREFLKKTALLAGGAAIVMAGIPGFAYAQIIPDDDPRLETEMITYQGESGEMMAYLAKPKGADKLPAVIIIHENRGLVPHIKDVTRRMALEGFIAIAPDALSPVGGTPDDVEDTRPLFREIDYEKTKKDFGAAVKYLQSNPQTTGMVGCTGFCWGGAMTNHVAVNSPDLKAAVPYYGSQPAAEDVPKIKADMMLHYAGEDERINAGIPAFEEALKKAGINYQIYIYEGAQHAFNNDSNPGRYHPEAAKLAWERTVGFFKEKLG
ncbi:dienelactone hydrolase family protein [candidate division KSB1 bacterium]|nr:dienelactone hydrolase family protein [candidate division KSB1 bacterium]